MRIEKKTTESAHLINLKSMKQLSQNTEIPFFSFTLSMTNIMQQEDYTEQPVEFKTAAQVTPKDFTVWFVSGTCNDIRLFAGIKKTSPIYNSYAVLASLPALNAEMENLNWLLKWFIVKEQA